jgi:hypothetical protein
MRILVIERAALTAMSQPPHDVAILSAGEAEL